MGWFEEIVWHGFPIVALLFLFLINSSLIDIRDSLREIKESAQETECSNCGERHHYSKHQCKIETDNEEYKDEIWNMMYGADEGEEIDSESSSKSKKKKRSKKKR